jgi:hypothetical protein
MTDKPRGNMHAGRCTRVTLVAETQMKFARTCIPLAILGPGSFSGQATPHSAAYEVGEKAGEQTPLTEQILLEISRFSRIGNIRLPNSQVGSIVPPDAIPSRQSAR